MKRLISLLSFSLLLITTSLQAGVTYKVIYNFTLSRYEVYMNSSTAYSGALARISSSQVTVVVPHNTGFTPINLTGGNGNGGSPATMNWGVSRFDGPSENPTKDYLFFGYNASANPSVLFNIPANTDILLFHFQNSGTCNGTIALIENATSATPDPFLPPNSQSLNTPNAMTIFGAGNINIYVANATGAVSCLPPTTTLTATYPTTMTATVTDTLKLTITNSTGNPAFTGLGYTYTVPVGLTVNVASITNSCGGTPSVVGNVLTFTGGSLSSGTASCVINVPITAATGPATITANNTNGTALSSNITNGIQPATITINPEPCAANAGVIAR